MNVATPQNPFPGLRPFQEQDDQLFFGRDSQIDELLERLQRTRFVAVVGTSGSGKSSLVRAGLIPSLHGGYMASAGNPNWRVVITRPGSSPIGNLASALTITDPGAKSSRDVETRVQLGLARAVLGSSALGLVEFIRQARNRAENVLVIVDQFEELFRFDQAARLSSSAEEATAFVRLLSSCTTQHEAPIYILLTMRSDFLGDCARFRDLPEALNKGLFLVPRLTREQLREAIEGPVAVVGATITPRLVNALLEDVGDDPDQLPPLQHALMRTYDVWARSHDGNGPIDIHHYEETGKIRSALSIHGDYIYSEFAKSGNRDGISSIKGKPSLQVAGDVVIERLFKALTERGGDGRRVRRPTSVADCVAVTGATKGALLEVVAAFRERQTSFLMPPPDVTIEDDTVLDITHESLMENWTRLSSWVDEEAESALQYKRLATAAELHANRKAALWRDPELTLALRWKKKQMPTLGWAKRYDSQLERNLLFLRAARAERLGGRIPRMFAAFCAILLAAMGIISWLLPSANAQLTYPIYLAMGLSVYGIILGWIFAQIRLRWLVWKLRKKSRSSRRLAKVPTPLVSG